MIATTAHIVIATAKITSFALKRVFFRISAHRISLPSIPKLAVYNERNYSEECRATSGHINSPDTKDSETCLSRFKPYAVVANYHCARSNGKVVYCAMQYNQKDYIIFKVSSAIYQAPCGRSFSFLRIYRQAALTKRQVCAMQVMVWVNQYHAPYRNRDKHRLSHASAACTGEKDAFQDCHDRICSCDLFCADRPL